MVLKDDWKWFFANNHVLILVLTLYREALYISGRKIGVVGGHFLEATD